MEKKTIGKFISALRRANGMTQRELGDRLYVSDKTVSRWERDECAPELHLIPAIAEIFGITTDELLSGERNRPEYENEFSQETKNTQKSDKQFKLMLHKRLRMYKNLTLISYGIAFIGFIIAIICNLALTKGLIAFCIASAFILASEIVQICFAVNTRLLPDEDEEAYREKIEEANTKVVKSVIVLSFTNLAIFAFCLPIVTLIDSVNYGLSFNSWITFGSIFTAIALAVSYVIYKLYIKKALLEKGILVLSKGELDRTEKNNRLLKKCLLISVSIALVLAIAILVLNILGIEGLAKKEVFETPIEFKEYMEKEYDEWYKHGTTYYDKYGNVIINPDIEIINPEIDKDYTYQDPKKVFETLKDDEGNVICEYYHNPDLYRKISFSSEASDKMPVTVLTNDAYRAAANMFSDLIGILWFLISIDFIITAIIYVIKSEKTKRRKK